MFSVWFVAEQYTYENGVADTTITVGIINMVMIYLGWGDEA